MNIFNKVTLQSMKKSRTRTFVTIIGVILSAAMITAVATFAVSLQNFIVRGMVDKYGGWHVEFVDVNGSFVEECMRDKEVESTAAIENIGYAEFKGCENPNKPYLFIAGLNDEAFEKLPLRMIAGRMPENNEEVIVPAHTESNGGVKFSIGDTISLDVGNRMNGDRILGQHNPYMSGDEEGSFKEAFVPKKKKTYKVVGICQRPTFEEYTAPGYTLITTGEKGDNYSLFVKLKNPSKVHSYAKNKGLNDSYVINDEVLQYMGISDNKAFNLLFYSIGGILVILIMTGSVFLIYNSFTISMNDRIRQFGILLSVGATEKQLRNSVLFEGFCIGLIGIPFGILFGIPSIRFVLLLVAKNCSNIFHTSIPLELKISVSSIIFTAVVSMITILISAYIPAKKAASTPVMECIRQTNEVKISSKAVKTSKLVEKICGLEGTLALKNFRRNKKRYNNIVLSLTLSVVLFISSSTFGNDLKNTAQKSVIDNDYDICFFTNNMDEEKMFDIYEQIKSTDGIYGSSYQATLGYLSMIKAEDYSEEYRESAGYNSNDEVVNMPIDIQFIEESEYFKFIESLGLSTEEYNGEKSKMIAVAKFRHEDKLGKSEMINMIKSKNLNVSICPQLNDSENTGDKINLNLTFEDTVPLDSLPVDLADVKPYFFTILAPYDLKEKFEVPDIKEQKGLTFLSHNPSQSVAQIREMIESSGISAKYTLYNTYEIMEQNKNILFVVNLFTYVFVAMISLIAIANVFNTISTNIKLRRRELAMLRSIGMSDNEFYKMMGFECIFYGLKTLSTGIPIAAILSWMIHKGMVLGGSEISFDFPWPSIGISILGVFLIIFITMMYAVSKLKKENIIDGLRDDMA